MIPPNPASEPADAAALASRWGGWCGIALVFAAGCWIRWKIAAGDLLWLDELHTGWAVADSFEQTLTRSAQGNQAPLFFGLVWSAVQWLGNSEFSLRLVSLLAGSLAMAMAARFVWLQTKSLAAATVTLTLIAIDDQFIWYATEARPYALLQLASIVQSASFWRSVGRWRKTSPDNLTPFQNHGPGTIALLLSSWLVVYTHYTGALLLAAEILFVVVLLLVQYLPIRAGKNIIATIILFTLGCLPLALQMNQAFGKPADWSSVAKLDLFRAKQTANGIRWFVIPLIAVGLATVSTLLLNRKSIVVTSKPNRWKNVWWLGWIVVWFSIPLLIIVALQSSAGIPIALSRYLSVSLIAGPIFAGALVGSFGVQSRWVAIPLILLASIYAQLHVPSNRDPERLPLPLRYQVMGAILSEGQLPLLRFEDWKSPIEAINDDTDKRKWPVFLFGAVIEDAHALSDSNPEFQTYLQFPIQSLYAVESDNRVLFAGPTMLHQHFDDRHLDEIMEQGGAWVLVRHVPQLTQEITNELERSIRSQLDAPNATIEVNWFGNRENLVQLISIEIKP